MAAFHLPSRAFPFAAFIAGLHLLAWGLLLVYALPHPSLLGLGALAYTFGLRHAFDADHIAAIDATTRKLSRPQHPPLGVGFFFSLGHSTVVMLLSLLLVLAVRSLLTPHSSLASFGAIAGPLVSGFFLLLVGAFNAVILVSIVRSRHDPASTPSPSGPLAHLFGRLFRLITHSWQMYPVGFLFGLGFDTASEVALLAVSAAAAVSSIPLPALLALPLAFAAGMTLMDTLDGALMSRAYSWASASPTRRFTYNFAITALSAIVALALGLSQLLQLLARLLHLPGPLATFARTDLLSSSGWVILALFVIAWAIAFVAYRRRSPTSS